MKKLYIFSAFVLGLATTSCDSYLDINQDPNSPSEDVIEASMIMPAAEMNMAASYGSLFRIPAGYFTQHFAQQFGTSNYVTYGQFEMSATRSSRGYNQFFRAIANLQTVIEKETANEAYASVLAAKTLQAVCFEAMVDVYGSIPYFEALDISNTSPKYDDGLEVYKDLVASLDAAIANCTSATNKTVCTNFLFPDGTYADWIQFANALKLRLLTRISGVADVQAQLDALVAENNFPTADVAYTSCWGTESGTMNPYYSEEFASNFGSNQINVIANMALIATMQQTDSEGNEVFTDPRLAAFFEKNGEGKYFGGLAGTNASTANGLTDQSFCRPKADAQMPLSLISKAEVEFFLAEYYAKKGDATNAESHYNAATKASCVSAGLEETDADVIIARYPLNASNLDKYAEVIGIAKWVALSGVDNLEAYAEMRRLRYPAMGTVTGADIWDGASAYTMDKMVPGVLYTPYQVYNAVGTGHILERWPYSESSSTRNKNCPKFQNSDFTTKIFFAN